MAKNRKIWALISLCLVFALMLTVGLVAMPQSSNRVDDVAFATSSNYTATYDGSSYSWEEGDSLVEAPTKLYSGDTLYIINDSSDSIDVYVDSVRYEIENVASMINWLNLPIDDTYSVSANEENGTITLTTLYSVTYDLNGATGTPPTDTTQYKTGESVTLRSLVQLNMALFKSVGIQIKMQQHL